MENTWAIDGERPPQLQKERLEGLEDSVFFPLQHCSVVSESFFKPADVYEVISGAIVTIMIVSLICHLVFRRVILQLSYRPQGNVCQRY